MTVMSVQQRTPVWEWLAACAAMLIIPPITLAWSTYRLARCRGHEWLPWTTLTVLSGVISAAWLTALLR